MNKMKVKSKPKTRYDIEGCKVVDIGLEGYAECLQNGPNQCAYALPFGYCFLCGHPRLDEIMERTKKTKQTDLKN